MVSDPVPASTTPGDALQPTLPAYGRAAVARLDPALSAWLDGGGDGRADRANRAGWEAIDLWPRVLRRLQSASTATRLLGRECPVPWLVAPIAHLNLLHGDGDLGCALAAAAQGAGFVLSMQAQTPLETVARAVAGEPGRGPLALQLVWPGARASAQALAERAAAAGFDWLVLTVDAPVQAPRDAPLEAGFRLPAGLPQPNAPAGWSAAAKGTGFCGGLMAQAPDWDDVAWLAARAPLPLLLKGILHPHDARMAADLGAAAVIVSNHGGRGLDAAPATARALPAVAQAVAGRLPVLVDGGIRRGSDVLRALALGASAVLIGRPVAWALACAGARGAAHALRLLRDELEVALALCGVASPAEAAGLQVEPSAPSSGLPDTASCVRAPSSPAGRP